MYMYAPAEYVSVVLQPRFSPYSQARLERRFLRQPWSWTSRAAAPWDLPLPFLADPRSTCSEAPRCSRSQQRGPGRVDPLAQQMELRLGEKVTPTPLALPRTRVRDGSQDAPRTHRPIQTHQNNILHLLKHTQTRAKNHTQPGTTIKSVRQLKAKTPTDIPQHLSNKDNIFFSQYFLTHHACQELKQDGAQTPPITCCCFLADTSHLWNKSKKEVETLKSTN